MTLTAAFRCGKTALKAHIFLTGEVQTGKSTIIRCALHETGRRAGGFFTLTGKPQADGRAGVYLLAPGDGEDAMTPENCVGVRTGCGIGFTPFPEVFERRGTELIKRAEGCQVIVMDELGLMEEGAPAFQKTVLDCLLGETPVIGVIKPKQSKFLDAVRNSSRADVITVTPENRDCVLRDVIAYLK